jgi:hypothetical protein
MLISTESPAFACSSFFTSTRISLSLSILQAALDSQEAQEEPWGMRTTALSPATVSTMPFPLIINIPAIFFAPQCNTLERKEQDQHDPV